MKRFIVGVVITMMICLSNMAYAGDGAKVVNGYFVAWNGDLVMVANQAREIKFNGSMGYWMCSVEDVLAFGNNLMVVGYICGVPRVVIGGVEINTTNWEVYQLLGR